MAKQHLGYSIKTSHTTEITVNQNRFEEAVESISISQGSNHVWISDKEALVETISALQDMAVDMGWALG